MKEQITAELKRYNHLMTEIGVTYHNLSLKLGLTDSASQILYTASLHGDSCLISEIIALSGYSKQTINSALRKLEEEEIICLEQAEGRKKRVCLTEQGKALAKRTVHRIIAFENEIFASWTEQELEQYLTLTQRFLNDLKKKTEEL